ncbi:MAG: M23 family metallopeptidase [Bdellovibrionales bacterium]|nr:M23 family metallopeptidase [Bdellovibrionales bacterium]
MRLLRIIFRMGFCSLFVLVTACSSVGHHRKNRVGWLEAMERGSLQSRRVATSSVTESRPDSTGKRRGLLQVRSLASRPSVNATSTAFDSIRMSRWIRVARSLELSWPLRNVHVTSHFGVRGGDMHEGVDLRAPSGTPVYAAHDGVVLYSGSGITGYGNLVVIKSSVGMATVYGHNSRLLVRKGQTVTRGQRVALSGSTGRSSGPHLHFEVRAGLQPVDPLKFALREAPPEPAKRPVRGRSRSTLAAADRLR